MVVTVIIVLDNRRGGLQEITLRNRMYAPEISELQGLQCHCLYVYIVMALVI